MRAWRWAPPTTTRRPCCGRSSANGRLTEIPGKAAKRRIVLERIALEFEPGVHYDEKEVNATVGAFFNDYAALRRYLVDEGFLDRDTASTGGAAVASTSDPDRTPGPERGSTVCGHRGSTGRRGC